MGKTEIEEKEEIEKLVNQINSNVLEIEKLKQQALKLSTGLKKTDFEKPLPICFKYSDRKFTPILKY